MKIETLELLDSIKNFESTTDLEFLLPFKTHINFLQIVTWLCSEKYASIFVVNDQVAELHFIKSGEYSKISEILKSNFPNINNNYSVIEDLLYKDNTVKVLTYKDRFIHLDIDLLLTGNINEREF